MSDVADPVVVTEITDPRRLDGPVPPSQERSSAERALLTVLGVVLVVAASVLGLSRAVGGRSLPDTVTVYVVAAADSDVNFGIADAARHEADIAMQWLEDQTGRQFRRGPDFAEILHLSQPAAAYRGDAQIAFEAILADVARRARTDGVFPVVMADLRTDEEGPGIRTCGIGSQLGLVMLIQNCRDQRMATTSAWGSAASITIAHELVHGLGAVQACAPHGTMDGHVTDDPTDIVHRAGEYRRPGTVITLDADRADYFDHDNVGCLDIADSPLWLSSG